MRAQSEAAGKLKAAVGSSTVESRGDADPLYLSVTPLHQPDILPAPEIDGSVLTVSDLNQSD
jgi:hypothetical protein